jgi:hypothetical protein
MAYNVIEIKPVPPTDLEIQNEIRNATNNGSTLISIEIDPDPANRRLLIITQG